MQQAVGSQRQKGGRKYQVTAALLTYAAVSMAAIPIYLYLGHGQIAGASEHPAQAVLTYALIGLASPILGLFSGPVSGLIGVFILFIGIRYAWQATAAPLDAVDGPFENNSKSASATAG